MNLDFYSCAAVLAFTSVALCIDLKSHRIPNWLTVSSALLGAIYHTTMGGTSGALLSLGGFGAGFGILLILWLIGGGGGGDVKMMGAVGAWLGALPTVLIFVGSAVFAIVCAIVLAVCFRRIPSHAASSHLETAAAPPSALRQTIPYALPVTLAIWTLFAIELIR